MITLVACLFMTGNAVRAQSLSSPSYNFNESAVGTGGVIEANSTNYKATNSSGALVVGNSASANYQIESGPTTTDDPALSFSISSGAINFGDFSATTAATTTATFSVTNYTSFGYIVQIIGTPPTNGAKTIPALATATASTVGIEQFGINLVANTSPSSVGANPNNGQFGFGQAAPNYATSNQYRYVSGDTIALAPKSSGTTVYTMTYLVNVQPLTSGGQYTSNQTLIVVGTY
jgi:hypothetical protein